MSVTVTNSDQSNYFPKQIRFIIGNEACERFSYYGMRAILVIFMTQHLAILESDAKYVYHSFAAACYLTPLLGGFIADRIWGKYNTILYLSLFYCLGHGVLALFESRTGLYWGLGLIALGSGGIKPCVSSFVGDQFTEKNSHLLEKVYSVFYFSINFGAFFSSLLIPWILPKYGSSVAFGIPGILMAIATFILWMGRNQYKKIPPAKEAHGGGFAKILFYSLSNFSIKAACAKTEGASFLDVATKKFNGEDVDAAKAAWAIFKLFFGVSIFWALFDQQGSSWTLQAEHMDRNFLGMQLESSQIQALNPILVMILIPVFSYGVYPLVGKFFKVTSLRKMGAGMLTAAASFAMIGFIQTALDAGQTLSVGWQLLPYIAITCSEVMVSITGLEFAYTQAPASMKSTIMSFWLLTVFFGNFIAAWIAKLNVFHGSSEFHFYTILMMIVSLGFVWVTTRYKERSYVVKA